jgi:hypothetical protein
MRVAVPADRFGSNLAVLPKAGVPANGARRSDPKTLCCLPARCGRLDGSDDPLAQIQ